MKALTSKIFYLLLFFTGGIRNELTPDTENVCLQNENTEVTAAEKTDKPIPENEPRRCFRRFKSFICENITEGKPMDVPQAAQGSGVALKCCSGYKEQGGSVSKCVPECPAGCVHGECTAPDECTCRSGFYGRACDRLLTVARTTPKTTTRRNSIAETSTQEISRTTENGKGEGTTLMSEISEATNADFVTGGITLRDGESAVGRRGEVSDETTATESYDTEAEKEISRRKPRAAKMSAGAENPAGSVTAATTEEAWEEMKYNNRMENEGGLRNIDSYSTEKLGTEGSELRTNAKTVSESGDGSEPAGKSAKNSEGYYSTAVVSMISTVGGLVVVIGWLAAVKLQKKIRGSKTEKQRAVFSGAKTVSFADNLIRVLDPSKSLVSVSDEELNDAKVLLDLPVCDQSLPTLLNEKARCLEKTL